MRLSLVRFTLAVSAGFVLAQNAPTAEQPVLHAPTYYIVVSARLADETTVVAQGASNLPGGAKIAIQIGDGSKFLTADVCAAVGEDGFFQQSLRPLEGARFKFSPNLNIRAVFRTNECGQPDRVLRTVGAKGQYLGNDNYDNKIDVHMKWTPGMNKNPQLFQESGWYFGLSTSARVSQF